MAEPARRHQMQVRKRNGDVEAVDVNKIVRAVERCSGDLADVDPLRVATKTISGLYDGATTVELDRLSIRTAAELVAQEPQYSRLAARLLARLIDKEVRGQSVASFAQSVALSQEQGLIGSGTAAFIAANARKLDDAIDLDNDRRFEYFGLRTVYDRYLLRHPTTRLVIETPQYWLLRVACGLSTSTGTPADAIELYRLMASLAYLPSSPTLFNSGTTHSQLSSCYLLDSPRDEQDGIYERYAQIAKLSKFAGGIGVGWSRVRGPGALIHGTNGHSNGIVPFLRTLDASVAAVNQGGRRKGAACVYLEPWHPDVEEFLELRENTGEDARRTHNLNLANWLAIAPTATIASIAGCYECIEPQVSTVFKRETLSGEFLQINAALVGVLKELGLWTEEVRAQIKRADGSIAGITAIPESVRELFRTVWELPQKALIDLAAARGPFVDQSQSLSLFLASPTIGKLSSMYLYAWKAGLKTTYYLRSRPATRIQQATVMPVSLDDTIDDAVALSCSLENPETCEACQ